MAKDPTIKIESFGGNCPVQAWGTVGGKKFYFRARGEHWSMAIGGADPVCSPEWEWTEKYGPWPEAGFMPAYKALGFIAKAIGEWANRV